jgi:serine/threonine protein kinase
MTTTVETLTGSENCLPIGTRLHDFEITGILGEGGFGIVYIAFDHSLQRTVAIKEYMPGALAARGDDHSVALRAERHKQTFNVGLKSFINEARFLAQFDHPGLVKVYRFWEQNQTAYTAMQYYEGRTIKDIVAENPELVTEAWCLRILKQILEALDLLYTMRILHRDISPDNIIVQDNGDAVLLDFGSARQIIGDMTQGLTVILKPGYAPAEQYAGDASLEQGPYTDIYALAAVIYFAILKEAPATSIARMIKDAVVPLTERDLPGFSDSFLRAIDMGLAVRAADRPQTIDEFRVLLGFAPQEAPRLRGTTTQRFATITHAGGGEEFPRVTPKTAPPAAAKTAPPAPAAAPPKAKAPVKAGKPVPRWMLAAGIGGVVLAAAVLVPLMGGGSSTVLVEPPQGAAPAVALPDASPAPAPAPEATAPAAASSPAIAEAPPAAAPAVPESITYKLAIKPWGTVYVDGAERGVSPPLKRLALTPGKHQIRVVNPSFPDYLTEVDQQDGKSGTIAHDFPAGNK